MYEIQNVYFHILVPFVACFNEVDSFRSLFFFVVMWLETGHEGVFVSPMYWIPQLWQVMQYIRLLLRHVTLFMDLCLFIVAVLTMMSDLSSLLQYLPGDLYECFTWFRILVCSLLVGGYTNLALPLYPLYWVIISIQKQYFFFQFPLWIYWQTVRSNSFGLCFSRSYSLFGRFPTHKVCPHFSRRFIYWIFWQICEFSDLWTNLWRFKYSRCNFIAMFHDCCDATI